MPNRRPARPTLALSHFPTLELPAMTWITLTPADLRARLSEHEIAAIARATGDLDEVILAEVLVDTTATVRGYIAAARGAVMGSAGIPPALKGTALDLALPAYSTRAGGVLLDPKGIRKDARDAALARLKDVADGKFRVEDPGETGAAPAQSHPGPAIDDPESVL